MAEGDRPHFQIPDDLVHDDVVNKTGFGSSYEREDHGEHGEVLVRRAQEFREAAARSLDSSFSSSLFFQVRTPEDVPIRGEKERLKNVGIEVVSYSRRDPAAGTARISRENYDDLEGRLLKYATLPGHPGRSYFSVVEDIRPVPIEEKMSPGLEPSVEREPIDSIVLTQVGLSDRERSAIVEEIRNFATDRGGEILGAHDFSSGISSVRLRLPRAELEELGHDFNTVREIRPNRVFMVQDSTRIGPLPASLHVDQPRSDIAVAIVDDGIQPRSAALGPVITGRDPFLPPGSVSPHYSHGTFVGSRAAYGDDIEVQLARGRLIPRCRLFDIPVIGSSSTGGMLQADEHGLAKSLDVALPRLPENVRVVNLSLGTDDPIRDHEYSLVASTLDFLAREHDLVIVTTAGNVRDRALVSAYPNAVGTGDWRIDPPGEALLALTVGSIANHANPNTMSAHRELSPFSRVGPGADGGRKPELVAHGGNYVRPCHPVSRVGVQGIHGDGTSLAWDAGTSFAAPLVAGLAAQLFDNYRSAEANLIKALLCHFTAEASGPDGEPDPVRCVGFGEPDLDAAISSPINSATFLHVGELTDDRYLFLPFYVPAALAEHVAETRLQIRGTIVYNPPVNPANPLEYSQARVAVKLRKPTEVGFREVQLSSYMESYVPWNPIIHFRKNFSRSYGTGFWELSLRLYTRDLPEDFAQRFAVVLEVRDRSSSGIDVWAAVRDEVGDQYQPIGKIAAA